MNKHIQQIKLFSKSLYTYPWKSTNIIGEAEVK